MSRGQFAAWGLLAMVAAWLLSPALHPVHVEGFSAAIVALGVHMAHGTLADFFPSQSFNTDYFGLTKLGAVMGVAGLVKLGLAGERAMRVLMALGAMLLVGGSARLVRYWTGAPWLIVAAVLLLIPGVAETGFFFNDNMLGAGLLVAALALFCDRQGVAATLATGALIGMAIAVRTDLVLVTPALLLIAWERQPLRQAALTTALAAITAMASLWLIYASVGASPLDALRAGAIAVELWDRPGDLQRQFLSLLLFLGLPALILYLLGLRTSIAAREWRRMALLLGIPLLVNLMLAGKIWEARQLLPLTPFLAAIAAQGAQRLVADWQLGQRRATAAFGVTIAAILLAPPAAVYPSDGPRAVIGRVGAIAGWHAWQARIRGNFALIDEVIATAQGGPPLAIVTDYWDEDRYLHLRLLEQGFRPAAQPRECDSIGQSMTKDGRTILQVSPHQTFLRNSEALYTPRLVQFAMPCLRASPGTPILIASADQVARLREDDAAPPPLRLSDTPLAAIALSPPLVERLARDHQLHAPAGPPGRYRTPAEAFGAMQARTRFGAR